MCTVPCSSALFGVFDDQGHAPTGRIFCVGVSTAFSIVMRLDKLMVAVKELVGEQYHIDGVGLPLYHRRGRGVEMRTPTTTI